MANIGLWGTLSDCHTHHQWRTQREWDRCPTPSWLGALHFVVTAAAEEFATRARGFDLGGRTTTPETCPILDVIAIEKETIKTHLPDR